MRLEKIRCLAFSAFLAFGGVQTWAQVPTAAEPVGGPVRTGLGVETLDELDARFRAGDLASAARVAGEIVRAAAGAGLEPDACDLTRNHVALVWAAESPDGSPVLRRLHLPYSDRRPYAMDLPGISHPESQGKLYEIFVAPDARATLASTYHSTRDGDPLVAQVPEMAEAVLGPFFALAAGLAGELQAAGARGRQGALPERIPAERAGIFLHVTAARVVLPFDRETVKVTSVASIPVSAESFARSAAELARSLRFQQVHDSKCGRAHTERLADVAAEVAATPACTSAAAGAGACLAAFDKAFAETRTVSAAECAALHAGDAGRNAAAAGVSSATQAPAEDLKAIDHVESRFRELAARSGPVRVQASVTFRNRPLAHFSFGLGGGVIVAGRLNRPRVREDRGLLVSDPLGREFSMAFVNWSPSGYDPHAERVSRSERFRPFAGAILTPDFGVGAGLSVVAVRGLGVNLGGGLLVTRAPAAGDRIGFPPADAKRPFALGVARVLYIGAGYTFR
ncbi:MAG: hypothetical protein ACE148_11485 [Vicinamibacterales bacterium]